MSSPWRVVLAFLLAPSSLLEYAREKLMADVKVYHWNLQNFAAEIFALCRFDSLVLHTFTER